MLRFFFLAIAAMLCVGAAIEAPAESPAVASARQRQERFKNVRMVYSVKDAVSPGGMSRPKDGRLIPENETSMESTGLAVLSENRIRSEKTLNVWIPHTRFRFAREIGVRVEEVTTRFFPDGLTGAGKPEGLIVADRRELLTNNLELPFTQFVRGCDSSICIQSVDTLKPTGRTLAIEGASCDEYEGGNSAKFWLDPKSGHRTRRMHLGNGPKPDEIDIEYAPDGESIMSWKMKMHWPTGELRRTIEHEVREWSVPPNLPAAEFEIQFPPGTLVRDSRDPGPKPAQPETVQESSLRSKLPLQLAVALAICLAVGLVVRLFRKRPAAPN